MTIELPGPGTRLASKYELEEMIGHGGFAIVFRAIDVTVDRAVAVKVLRPGEHGYEPTLASRFIREARLVASLHDEHTIRMYDFGRTDDGLLFMVFELLGGEDLSARLVRTGAMDEIDVEHVVRQVLSSLREAHARGLLHRDIKPGNIRLHEYQGDPLRAKLLDFGIAKPQGPNAISLTATGSVVGTPRYMSPEQITGNELGPPSDLFSLGLVACEMLTGERCRREDILLGKAVDIPATGALAVAIAAMLEADPEARPQSVQELLEILDGTTPTPISPVSEELVETLDFAPEPEPRSEPRDDRRSPNAVPIVTAVVLVAALVIVVGWLMRPDTPPPSQVVAPVPSARVEGLLRRAEQQSRSGSPAEPPSSADVGTSGDAPSVGDGGLDGCGLTPDQAGTTRRSIRVGLEQHRYRIRLPDRYDPTKRHSVLIGFHATGSGPFALAKVFKQSWGQSERQAILVMPGSSGVLAWRSDRVVPLARALVDTLRASYCIDPSRVFLFGNGAGGIAVDKLSCEPWVTAVATMGYRSMRFEFDCEEPARQLPSLHLAPLKSKNLPIKGGEGCLPTGTLISLKRHESRWKRRNGCRGQATVEQVNDSVCRTWRCESAFVSCHLAGGTLLPGQQPREFDVIGCAGDAADFPFFERIWGFFADAARADAER